MPSALVALTQVRRPFFARFGQIMRLCLSLALMTPSLSQAVDYRIVESVNIDHINACSRLLSSATKSIVSVVPEQEPQVYLGHFASIPELLRFAGMPSEGRNKLLEAINRVLDRSQDPLLKKIENRLTTSQRSLLFCIAGANCSFAGGGVSALTVPVVDDEIQFLSVDPTAFVESNFEEEFLRIFRLKNIPDAENDGAIAQYVAVFFHELVHFEDTFLFQNWIRNNLSAHAHRDRFFQDYARIADGRVYVSVKFFRMFSEARAYYVMAKALAPIITPESALRAYDLSMRKAGYRYLVNSGGQDFLDGFGVTEQNLFEIWSDLVKQMNLSPEFR